MPNEIVSAATGEIDYSRSSWSRSSWSMTDGAAERRLDPVELELRLRGRGPGRHRRGRLNFPLKLEPLLLEPLELVHQLDQVAEAGVTDGAGTERGSPKGADPRTKAPAGRAAGGA